jgi:RNA polymerase sigma factor (TIGR02999 family)
LVLGFSALEATLSPYPPPAGFPCFHLALREGQGKTVMPLRNSLRTPEFGQREREMPQTAKERQALDQLFSLAYEELRRLASSVKRGDPSSTLSATALVNEAWLKLAKQPGIAAASRLHFKRIAARAMRQLLVEAARRRNAHKRGGDGEVIFVSFDDSLDGAVTSQENIVALDAALTELARLEPRQALIVESRFFGGLEVSEISSLIGVSEATILRDWRAAKAWLGQSLRRAG